MRLYSYMGIIGFLQGDTRSLGYSLYVIAVVASFGGLGWGILRKPRVWDLGLRVSDFRLRV